MSNEKSTLEGSRSWLVERITDFKPVNYHRSEEETEAALASVYTSIDLSDQEDTADLHSAIYSKHVMRLPEGTVDKTVDAVALVPCRMLDHDKKTFTVETHVLIRSGREHWIRVRGVHAVRSVASLLRLNLAPSKEFRRSWMLIPAKDEGRHDGQCTVVDLGKVVPPSDS